MEYITDTLRIKVRHYRMPTWGRKAQDDYNFAVKWDQIQPTDVVKKRYNGHTEVRIEKRIYADGLVAWAVLAEGYAFCTDPHFSKKLGRNIATERAIQLVRRLQRKPEYYDLIQWWVNKRFRHA